MQTSDQTHGSYYAAVDEHNRMYNRRVCFLPEGVEVPGHPCVGTNRVLAFDGFFRTTDIFTYIREKALTPETIPFRNIWHQIHYEDEKKQGTRSDDPRFRDADTTFPGIVAAIRNPENKAYRMLDGRRRMWKLEAAGGTAGSFYVIPEPDVYEFFWMVMPMSALRQRMYQMPK